MARNQIKICGELEGFVPSFSENPTYKGELSDYDKREPSDDYKGLL